MENELNEISVPEPEETQLDTLAQNKQEVELKKSYEFGQAPIGILIRLFPEDNNPDGQRMAVVAVQNHQDAPIFHTSRIADISAVQPILAELLEELQKQLPTRYEAKLKQLREEQEEEDDSSEEVTAKSPKSKNTKRSRRPQPTSNFAQGVESYLKTDSSPPTDHQQLSLNFEA